MILQIRNYLMVFLAILDVLLVALADCLAENPQLVAAAKLSLSETGQQLAKQPDKH